MLGTPPQDKPCELDCIFLLDNFGSALILTHYKYTWHVKFLCEVINLKSMQNTPLEGVMQFMLITTSIDTDNFVSILKNLFGYISSDMNPLCNVSYVS